jgi:hypothetical protein
MKPSQADGKSKQSQRVTGWCCIEDHMVEFSGSSWITKQARELIEGCDLKRA